MVGTRKARGFTCVYIGVHYCRTEMIVLELKNQIVCNKNVECTKFARPIEMNKFRLRMFQETLGSQNCRLNTFNTIIVTYHKHCWFVARNMNNADVFSSATLLSKKMSTTRVRQKNDPIFHYQCSNYM